MSQEQNYQVNYAINVEATDAVEKVVKFGEAVGKLVQAKGSFEGAVKNINDMMQSIDKIFRTKNGRRRSYDFKLNIDTGTSEEKLERIKKLLSEIGELSKGINVIINAGHPFESRPIKKTAHALIDKKAFDARNKEIEQSAAGSVRTMMETQKRITKVIGKINAALTSLQRGREVNIQTDVAKDRLLEILSLLNRLKGASKMTLGLQMGSPGVIGGKTGGVVFPYSPQYGLSTKAHERLQEKLYTSQEVHRQKLNHSATDFEEKVRQRNRLKSMDAVEKSRQKEVRALEASRRSKEASSARSMRDAAKAADQERRQELSMQQKAVKERERESKHNALQSVKSMQRQQTAAGSLYRSKRRAAINRIQYSKGFSLRSIPFASMLNAYMGYSLMRSELTKAIEYSNIMESAHSILRVADNDLLTFETRFDTMARNVRRIGIDTKFTAVEIAGAVKYLSMAGMNIETINKSIRPVVDLALIGDNDVSYIADLATNIMAGYDIRNNSMSSVADIIASSVSRSNVNIVEMAESYKMAAGYLRTAGIDFSEASAAIGLLGNMGLKGTLAGTSLRALSTRFIKPTNEGQQVLDRLGVHFTEKRDVYGKPVERIRSIADIFQELHEKGASMADVQALFGKIAGNGAMMFIQNYGKLRELTAENRASYGISSELAKVKQDTTKGLWAQVTSQLTESFMGGYELLEPSLRGTLQTFLDKFKAPEFSKGLASIGQALLQIVKVIGDIGAWVTRNFHWIEPLIFTGVVSTGLFKLSGTLTNVGIALGFIGKQAAATSSIELIQGLFAMKGQGKISFAGKRSIVSALSSAGIRGKGAMREALLSSGGAAGSRGVLQSLFATQVATGNGLTGAAASLSAISIGAVAATAGVSALVGALGWVAYKTWKIKEAKDSMQKELKRNEKYRYPSIDALYDSLRKTYNQANDTKEAVDNVTKSRTIEDGSGQSTGIFTGNWWHSFTSMYAASQTGGAGMNEIYTVQDAYQDDIRAAIKTLAWRDSQSRINSGYAKLGKLSTALEVRAFMKTIQESFGQSDNTLDKTLWNTDGNGKVSYIKGLGEMDEAKAAKTIDYANYHNAETVPEIRRAAEVYLKALSSSSGAQEFMHGGGYDFDTLTKKGFSQDKNGQWHQKKLGIKATDEERENQLANFQLVRDSLIRFVSSTRKTFMGSSEAAENIMKTAGFTSDLYGNEPGNNDPQPFNANPITNGGKDDGGAGGNYSGSGKLSSAAPKQVIVNISNLMSIGTIDLLKSSSGQEEDIQDLKGKLAQALIDVVHDFDVSWNG